MRPCLSLLVFFSMVTGLLYPLAITGAARWLFPWQAGGSLLHTGDRVIGSRLIGQGFTGPEWFHPRPSAVGWNASGSGGANLASVAEAQVKTWADQAAALRTAGVTGTLPADLITASASGLDPHLSPEALRLQVPAVATARGRDPERLRRLIAELTEPPQLGFLGPPRVNVLELNRRLATLDSGGP